jgi:hypothetical protein
MITKNLNVKDPLFCKRLLQQVLLDFVHSITSLAQEKNRQSTIKKASFYPHAICTFCVSSFIQIKTCISLLKPITKNVASFHPTRGKVDKLALMLDPVVGKDITSTFRGQTA